jgi:uncharacterized repeat protein (TIGR01451 family)
MSVRTSRFLVVLSLATGVLADVGPAEGTSFPGTNGKIAFAHEGAIRTVNPDGSGLATLATAFGSNDVAWSADGKQIAYRAGAPSFGLAVLNQDGTGLRQLVSGQGNQQPAWSADDTKLAFTKTTGSNTDLMVVNADGTGATNLTSSFAPGVSFPQWAPQNDQIAFFADDNTIELINPDGTGMQSILPSVDVREMSWAPDGTKIAYIKGPATTIWSVDRAGTNDHQLAGPFSQVNDLAWSPDGTQIAFIAGVAGGFFKMFVMNADGSNQHQLSVDASGTLDWQPRPVADLQVTKTDAPDPVFIGQNVTYTITVTNAGPHPAFGARLVDALPSDVTFVSANATKGTCTGTTTVTCSIGWMPNAASVTVTVVVTANDVGTLANTATVSHLNLDPDSNPQNNTVTETTRVFDPGDLLKLSKADAPDPVLPGQNMTYTITVENIGGGTVADAVTVTDALPGAVSFVSAATTTGSCTGTTTVECALGSMAQGDTVKVTVVVKTKTEGTVTNTATVATTTTDPKPSNNSATATTHVGKTATTISLAVTKTSKKWTAKGALAPPAQGEKVTVTWYRKTGKSFKELSSTKGILDTQGRYTSSRSRVAGGSCKATAAYPGDATLKPSTKSKTFSC